MLRKRVPDELRSVLGKREEKLSLGARDPQEAKRLHIGARPSWKAGGLIYGWRQSRPVGDSR